MEQPESLLGIKGKHGLMKFVPKCQHLQKRDIDEKVILKEGEAKYIIEYGMKIILMIE